MNTAVPAFILSCERSGSTLLRYIVDTHPDIASPGQLFLGQLCQDLYTVVARTTGAVSTIIDAAEKDRMVLAEVRRIVSGLMDEYTVAKNKRIWCEKTTMNLDYLDIIKAVFPNAKYICLYRNAMDVVHSCIELSRLGFLAEHFSYVHRNPGNIVSAMLESWIDKTRRLLMFERQNSAQCFRIKYESYVLNPTKVLEPMFAFLGVAYNLSLLDSVFSVVHDQGDGDPKVRYASRIYQSSIGKGSTINRHYIPEQQIQQMNALLEELGYPLVGSDWDTAPSPYCTMDSTPETGNLVSTVEDIFTNYFPQQLNKSTNRLQHHKVVYKVVVTGNGGGIWMLDLTRPNNQVTTGDGKADCTFTMSSQDLIDLINGNLNAAEASMQGKLHVGGNPEHAAMLGQILFSV